MSWHTLHLRFIAGFLTVVAVQSTAVFAADEQIDRHQRNLAEIEQRMLDLEQDLGARRDHREDLVVELEQRERDIAALARAGHRLTAMIGEQEHALAALRRRLVAERLALRRERAALGSLLRSAYAMGPGDRLRLLFNQENPNRLSRVMAYYEIVNRYRIKRIEAVAERARRLDSLSRQAQQEMERLSLLAHNQEATRTRLKAAQDERSALLSTMEAAIATRSERVAEMRAQARELRLLLEQLEQRARALPEAELRQESLTQLRGRLAWPLPGAPLLSHYGSPKGDGTQVWDGVVLGSAAGAEVHAVHHGRVAYASWLRGFGLLLIIEHDDAYMTLYGHNQALLKEPGEWVATGDTVALSGSSGGRATPGLYFAIRHRGRPLNPEQWCTRDLGRWRDMSAPEGSRLNALRFLYSNQTSILEQRTPMSTALCRLISKSIVPVTPHE